MADSGNNDGKICSCTGDTMNPEYVTKAELEAAILQIYSEIAEDRKRITVIEEFSRELYSILFVKFRSIRMDLETRLKSHVPYFFSSSTPKQSMEEVTH